MENTKPSYEELEQEVIRLRKLQEDNILSNDELNSHHECMHRVNNAIQNAADIDEMMSNVLQAVLGLFDVERAWLLFPCDPNTISWTVPMERTKPGYEGVHVLGEEIPILPKDAEAFARLQNTNEVVTYDYSQNPKETSERFSVLSEMHMPLHPKTGKSWLFGIHQCTYARVWTNEEKIAFKEIGNRLSDALNSFLYLNELKASEYKFKSISEVSPLAIMMSSGIEKRTEYVNPAFIQLFGYTLKEVPSIADWWRLAYPNEAYRKKTASEWEEKVEHAINTESEIEPIETIITCKDGSKRNITWSYVSSLGQNWAFGLDITEQKQAEDSLRRSKYSLENLTNSLTDIVISVKMPERVIEWSNHSIRSIAYEPDEIIGQTTAFLFTNEENYLDFGNRLQRSVKEGNEVFIAEQLFKRKNGDTFSADVRVTCDIKDGEIVRATSIIRDITEQKQAEYHLQESEEKYRALFDNAPLSYQSLDKDGKFIDINPSWLRTLGYQRHEVIGKFYADFLHPDWKAHFEKNFPAFKKRGYVNDVQFKIRHKKGHYIDISFEGCIGYLPDGSFKQTYCVFQDITEKKNAEILLLESEEKYKQLYESNQMPISIFETETLKFLSVNNAFVKKYGYTEEEFLKMTILDIRPDTETDKLKKSVAKIDKEGLTNAGVFLHKKKNGEIIYVEIIRYDLVFEGKNAKLVFANDITERIQADEKLKDSEEKFRSFVNTASDLMCITNKDGLLTDVNSAMVNILDYSIEELMEMYIPNLLTKEALKNDFQPNWGKFIEDGKIKIETTFSTKSGKEIPGELKAIAIYDSTANFIGSRAIFIDLTERKKVEEALRESETRLRMIVNQSTLGISVADLNGRYVSANPAFEKLTGYTEQELLDMTFYDLTHPDDRTVNRRIFEGLSKEDSHDFTMEKRYIRKDGTEINLIIHGGAIFDATGRPQFVLGLFEDITERKQAEEELKNITERLKFATEGANIGTWHWNTITGELIWSSVMKELFDIPQEEVMTYERFRQTLHPDDRTNTDEAVKIALDNHTDFNMEYRCIWRDGTVHWRSALGRGYYDESGKNIRMEGVVIDINDQKQAEQALIRSQEKLNLAIQGGEIGIWEWDLVTNLTIWDAKMERMFGLTEGEFDQSYDAFKKCVHPDDIMDLENAIKNAIDGVTPYDTVFRVVWKNKEVKYIRAKALILKDNKDQPIIMIGICIDVSKIKMVEEQLKKHKENLEELVVERTKELEGKNAELERMNKLFVGRELRMVELKEKIKDLKGKTI